MTANNQIIRIEPSILIWARESLGLSIAEVALKLDKDSKTIQQWEHGNSFPTLAQLEKLAYNIYKRPLAVFFLPKPPKETTPKQDFRTLPENEIARLSPDLRLIIRKAKHHQLVLKQINDNKNPVSKPIHREFNLEKLNSKNKFASNLREYLGITKSLQQNFKNPELAFNYYRNLIEKNGVFVFQYPLKEIRGFSLTDREFPVIVINSGDSPNGKIFSLFHELCHILFNTGGIFRDYYSEELKQNPNKIEVLCNQFASDILLPGSELLKEVLVLENSDNKEWSENTLRAIAFNYKVSKEVVLRKLLEAGKTTQTFYVNTRIKWNEKYKHDLEKKQKTHQGGPTYHITNMSHLGKNFVTQVLTNYHSGKLTGSEVADFLSIKLNRIPDYEKKVF
jgi:Zn-dependent peptidase ImmA (M78 family)/transcriptional regulator with XRE-family HTH domain